MIEERDKPQFNEAHYQLAMEAAGIGMWDWDLVQDRQTWSKECKAILGVLPGTEEAYPSFLSLLHPDDREQVQRQLDETHPAPRRQGWHRQQSWPGLLLLVPAPPLQSVATPMLLAETLLKAAIL